MSCELRYSAYTRQLLLQSEFCAAAASPWRRMIYSGYH